MKWILLSIVVVTTVLADLLQSREMKATAVTRGEKFGLSSIVKAIGTRPNLILAIVMLTISFFAFLALVQTQPLSFAVPASAATFVLEMALSRLVLNERVDAPQAVGALLVLAGIVLLGR
jgi:drug/metabolite transporter (DMT)-like permease